MQDPESLKRFLLEEDIGELPSEEEVWAVPEPRRDATLESGMRSTQAMHTPAREQKPSRSISLARLIVT